MSGRRHALLGFTLLGALAGLLYGPGVRLVYFGDDFLNLFLTVPGSRVNFFRHPNPLHPWFYRPLETSFLSFFQDRFPETTLPIHLTTLALHVLLCWVLLLGLRRVGFPTRAAWLAAVFMAVSQANVSAVISNDTLSQTGSALFGCVSLLALLGRAPAEFRPGAVRDPPGRSARMWSTAAFALAALSKETGLFFLPLLLGAGLSGSASGGWPS